MNKSEKLKSVILSRYKSLREFSAAVGIPNTTLVSALDRGIEGMAIEKVIQICDFLNIDIKTFEPIITDSLMTQITDKQRDMLKKYEALDSYGQEVINAILDIELKRTSNKKIECPNEDCTMPFPYFSELPASAGTGEQCMDIIYADTVYLKKYPPNGASFIIRISGDSMEPEISDGDKIFIKKQSVVEVGEIGAFFVNGNMYIKKLGQNKLISLNEKYKPIKITEYTTIVCYGKYVGKCEEDI